jgi:hypothetical protein
VHILPGRGPRILWPRKSWYVETEVVALREPWHWREDEVQDLIREQRKEDLTLEYKRSDALEKTDERKRR